MTFVAIRALRVKVVFLLFQKLYSDIAPKYAQIRGEE